MSVAFCNLFKILFTLNLSFVVGVLVGQSSTRNCRAPEVLVRSKDGVNITSNAIDFHDVLEVQFLGIFPPFQHRRVCKIKCVNGRWLGPLCSIEEDGGRFQPMLRSCDIEQPPPNVHLIYNGKVFWPAIGLQFAHGTSLHARCKVVGLYKFVGNSTIRCRNGHWEKRLPSCLPTTYVTNFTDNVPPSVLYAVASGSAAPSDHGDLMVYPGSILNLDCIFLRRDGNPQWSWTPSNRQYPTGWMATPQERNLRYRLSVYYARPHDTGLFTCSTPFGLTNSISVVVRAIECPTIRVDTSTTRMVGGEGFRLNDNVGFVCAEGHLLVGQSAVTCLWTGKWSNDPPTCKALYCPDVVPADLKVKVESMEKSHRGRARFRCPRGHRFEGPSEIICLNGTWSDGVPSCEAVYCGPPPIPEHSRMLGGDRHLVGDKIQYVCDPGYVLVGESYIFCVGQGTWDNGFPTCKPACLSPGSSPSNGHISPVTEHYDVGDFVTVSCDDEFMIHGAQKLVCQHGGKWSHPVPQCKPFTF